MPGARNKTKLDLIRPLPKAAQDLLDSIPRIDGCDQVFTHDGIHAASIDAAPKTALQLASGTSGWTLHDLRRTSRSLLSRVGVPADHGELILGHLLPGMRRVYDRYSFLDEKRRALEKLAALIDTIVHPQESVIPFSVDRKRTTR